MKKLFPYLLVGFVCINLLISCDYYDGHNISLQYSETDQYYSMEAHFNKNKMRDVEEYMDSRIGRKNRMSFINSRIDGKLALDDRTTFYIKKYPGTLEIKLDKDENSNDSYREIKDMCQGIKRVVIR